MLDDVFCTYLANSPTVRLRSRNQGVLYYSTRRFANLVRVVRVDQVYARNQRQGALSC